MSRIAKTCKPHRELYPAIAAGAPVRLADRGEALHHAEHCLECQRSMEALRTTWAAVAPGVHPDPVPSDLVDARIARAIHGVRAAESSVTALDVRQRVVAWSQTFDGIAFSRIRTAGDAILFTTVAPGRLHVFEADTGRRLSGGVANAASRPMRVAHVEEDLVVFQSDQRFLEARSLPAGELRWRVSLMPFVIRGIEGVGGELILMGVLRKSPEKVFLAAVDLETGKIARLKEDVKIGTPQYLAVDAEQAYVVARDGTRAVRVSGVRLEDLSVAWTSPAGKRTTTIQPPAMAKGHVVVPGFEADTTGKFAYRGVLLDKVGRVVQNIDSGYRFERPPLFSIAGDRVVFSVDTKVDVHR